MIYIKTLYISDLDGTLLNSSGELSENTASDLNFLLDKGMHFTFATARTIYSAGAITAALDIDIPCILMNGVCIYDLKKREYVNVEAIPRELADKVASFYEEYGVECFMFRICGQKLTTYYTKLTERVMASFAEDRQKKYGKPFVQCSDFRDVTDGDAVYFTSTSSYESLLPVRNAVKEVEGLDCAFYEDTYTGKWYLEVFSSEASKANGIKKLRKLYGYEKVVCFGDNLNDLAMFEQSDVKIAVENAREEVRAAADIIIGSNDNNGVAEYLKERTLSSQELIDIKKNNY
ncbi:MAG: HAD family hydrolase [Ruminococcus sp.]|nr:HAD family hydrolase [Ruminococcus sp.]